MVSLRGRVFVAEERRQAITVDSDSRRRAAPGGWLASCVENPAGISSSGHRARRPRKHPDRPAKEPSTSRFCHSNPLAFERARVQNHPAPNLCALVPYSYRATTALYTDQERI